MKKINLWKLMDSPKFNCAFIVINLILIVILGSRVVSIYNRVSNNKHQNEVVEAQGQYESDETEEIEDLSTLFVKADEEMLELYIMILENSSFELENGISFRFYSGGKFEGYFDSYSTNISGYYEIAADSDKNTLLVIYNDDKSKYVNYYISLDENGNIILRESISKYEYILGF